jgi:hypothetical protein
MIVALITLLNQFDDRLDLLEFRAKSTEQAVIDEHDYVQEKFKQIKDDLNYILGRVDANK